MITTIIVLFTIGYCSQAPYPNSIYGMVAITVLQIVDKALQWWSIDNCRIMKADNDREAL